MVARAQQNQADEYCPNQQAFRSHVQVMTLLRAAGGEQEGASWDQGELVETLWAEMGLQPDAHITYVCTAKPAISKHCCRTYAANLAWVVASSVEGSCPADKPKRSAH